MLEQKILLKRSMSVLTLFFNILRHHKCQYDEGDF